MFTEEDGDELLLLLVALAVVVVGAVAVLVDAFQYEVGRYD